MLLQQWWYRDDSDAENRTYEQTIRKFEIVFESIHWLYVLFAEFLAWILWHACFEISTKKKRSFKHLQNII